MIRKYKCLSSEEGILVDIFSFFYFFHYFFVFIFLTCHQSRPLVTKLNLMKIVAIILQSIWTLLGL